VAAEPPQDGSTMHMREAPINHNAMRFAALMLGTLALAGRAGAQDWPTRQLTMVVPFAAGGPVDVIARIVQRRLGEVLGQQIVVENVGGAGGMTGSLRVAQAAPDGYTFVLGSSGTHAINQSLYKKPLYNAATDFAPVMLVAEAPLVLITRKDLPANSLREFVDYAKANQGRMQFGSAGVGTTTHIGGVLFNQAIGVEVLHVPYRGGGPALAELVAGRIDYICNIASTAIPAILAKTVNAIAMLAPQRSPTLADVPTAQEQGLKDFEAFTWNAMFLPLATPPAIVRKLNEAMNEVLNTPAVRERLDGAGLAVPAPERRSPDYLGSFVRSEIEKWGAPIRASGASGE
jgi:tripartite-type tricarboxylate transporter receptor subunit TctC